MSRLSLRLSATTAAALALTVGSWTSPADAVRVSEPVYKVGAGGALALSGHGYGHGRGMSQYGAQGAARKGLTAAQILAFYYPGTTIGRGAGRISVRIGADTSADTVVAARSGLVARIVGQPTQKWSLATLRRDATRWRLKPISATRTALAYRTPGHRWARAKVLEGTAEFFAAGAPITLVVPGGTATYRGALRSVAVGGSDRDTVNVLSLQNYLRGVVASEMPAGWSPAALQAQAIAARTYAAYERAHTPSGRRYQTCDSTSCQVYRGVAAETATTDAAVAATRGQIVAYAGRPAFTQFGSSNGGWTVGSDLPYQRAQADPYDPAEVWRTKVTAAAIQAAWPAIGRLRSVQVVERDGNGEWGGRVLSVKLVGSTATKTVDGADFRSRLGLRSQWFTITG